MSALPHNQTAGFRVHDKPLDNHGIMRVRCTNCSQRLRVRSVHAGKLVSCPACRQRVHAMPMSSQDLSHGRSAMNRVMLWLSLDAVTFMALGWMLSRTMFG